MQPVNTRAIEFLKEDPSLSLLLNGSLMHVRGCAHILNLFVQKGPEGSDINAITEILSSMKVKWYNYFKEFSYIYGIAATLYPGVKTEGLTSLLTFYYQRLGNEYGVDEYLLYQFKTDDDFHIIKWWTSHSTNFPILSKIAKDILIIPALTIASKCTFSACRRVLNENRSRLASQSIE
ncbi:putative AC transposase, partial [Bienertia sinuspersici]